MPWLPFFADTHDAERIIDWLNRQEEIAWLLPDGSPRWKAVATLAHLGAGSANNADGDFYSYLLWHTKGPLGLDDRRGRRYVENPWTGWEGPKQDGPPLFGPGYSVPYVEAPGLYSLELCTRHRPYTPEERKQLRVVYDDLMRASDDCLSQSVFFWAESNAPEAREFWERFAAWVATEAAPLFDQDEEQEYARYWAFPSARAKLEAGMAYSALNYPLDDALPDLSQTRTRPFPLDDAIQAARLPRQG